MAYVGISRRAAYDIDEIDTYSQQEWGQKVADDYITSIDLALQRLADNPGLVAPGWPHVAHHDQQKNQSSTSNSIFV